MKNSERMKWVDTLTRKMDLNRIGEKAFLDEQFLEMRGRSLLVVKTRWVLLLLLSLYGLYAGGFFYFSRYGFFLTSAQIALLVTAVIAVVAYNYALQRYCDRLSNFSGINQLQIFLDLLFVTILVQLSGGAASWFWPVYLIVTIEASFLLEEKKHIWTIGMVGTFLYCGVLMANLKGIFPPVKMPFVADELHSDRIYLVLMSCWVAILNATVALISSYFMSVIRRDTSALRESEEQLCNFLDTANDLIFSITPGGKFIYVNQSWQDIIGYSLEELSARTFFDVVQKECQSQFHYDLQQVISGARVTAMENVFVTREGKLIAVEGNLTCSFKHDSPAAVWGICRDVTERLQAEEQLYHIAHHDPLTGLPNRVLMVDRLTQAKALANRLKQQMAVLFLDLDRFKIINDTLGHEVGDRLLQIVAARIKGCLREIDTVSRIGGDEFVAVLVNINTGMDAEKVAQKIVKTLSQPFNIDINELFVTASIGIAIYPSDSDDPETLIKKADIAMYSAKGQGRNNFQFYQSDMDEHAEKMLSLATSIRKALDRDEFSLHYQPKVDILSGRITSMEALLRWEHPELGQLPPAEFIPLAEETGLILPLGEWVLNAACRQNKLWQDQGLPHIRVAVNISGFQLQQKNITEIVRNALDESGLDADFLEFEITETVIMQNPDFAVTVLSEFRELGIHISIDDFGTGYSSLAHLKRFSINNLKIDKSFVRDVEINSTDAAIATAIIAMGNSLNLKIIAEGVETEGQLSFLRKNLCDEIQGFFFSKPLPADEAAKLLREIGGKRLV
jgi:diguanylate cyclase (GGDEF)-like protein/PAS domain S-box-containing protein